MDGMECDVCFHQYDEDERQPRTLSCGHTLCTVCVTEGISHGQLTCPFCRDAYDATTASDVRINFSLLKVIRSLATAGLAAQKNSDDNSVPSRTALEPELHAGACAEHGSYRLFWCLKCQVWLCRDCTVVEHPAGTCSVIAIKQALSRMKEEEENLVDQTVTSGNRLASKLCDYQTKLNENDERHDKQLKAIRELKENQMQVKQLLNKENERVEGCLEYLQKALGNMSVACRELAKKTTVEGTTTARHECQRLRRRLDCWIKQSSVSLEEADVLQRSEKLQKEMQIITNATGIQTGQQESQDSLLITSAILKRLMKFPSNLAKLTIEDLRFISNPFPVFATLEDESRVAPVTIENGVIHLHALRETMTPSTALKLPYLHVRSLAKEPSQVFFDISWEGQKKGRVYIDVVKEGHESESFLKRCTGEVSNSFVSCRMIQVLNRNYNNWDRVCVGGDGRSGSIVEHRILQRSRNDLELRPTLETLTAFNPSYSNHMQQFSLFQAYPPPIRQMLLQISQVPGKGRGLLGSDNSISTENLVTLCTFNGITCFSIWLKSTQFTSNESTQDIVLGRVSSGMEVIQEAANYHNVTDVTVSDCGLLVT